MKNQLNHFKDLHNQSDPLLLGNVWDAHSALQLQKLGFKALGTSSAAIASTLGYEDGENMPFSEYLLIIKRIAASTKLPVSVDLEAGYWSDASTVLDHIKELSHLGIVGINLEDSHVENASRTLVPSDDFASKLAGIYDEIKRANIDIFINLRIDTFLLQVPNAMEESTKRIAQYSKFIDGVFLPCIASENDIEQIVNHTALPLNVMSVPDLPNFEKLKSLGVKRISTGNFLYDFMNQKFAEKVRSMLKAQSFDPLFKD